MAASCLSSCARFRLKINANERNSIGQCYSTVSSGIKYKRIRLGCFDDDEPIKHANTIVDGYSVGCVNTRNRNCIFCENVFPR